MVLKAYDGHVKKVAFQHDVADQASLALLGIKIHQIKACDGSLFGLVVFAEKLIAAADGDNYAAVLHIFLEIRLDLFELLADQHLLPVGASAQKHNVQSGKINFVA